MKKTSILQCPGMVCSPPVVSKCIVEAHRRLKLFTLFTLFTLHYITSFFFIFMLLVILLSLLFSLANCTWSLNYACMVTTLHYMVTDLPVLCSPYDYDLFTSLFLPSSCLPFPLIPFCFPSLQILRLPPVCYTCFPCAVYWVPVLLAI